MNILSDGLFISPPPFFQAKWFYKLASKNPLFVRLGKLGTKFGEKYRSQIFVVAFLTSVISWVFLAIAMCTMAHRPALISSVPLFQGQFLHTIPTSESTFFGGLNAFVYSECDVASTNCADKSLAWSAFECSTRSFANCDACKDATLALFMPALMAFLTQVLQILGDVQRSTARGDLHFMKMIGIVTGIFGLVSTLAPLHAFATACVTQSAHARLGTAYYLLTAATWLKIVDIVAHAIVPVPETGYWEPDSAERPDGSAGNKKGKAD